MLETLAIVAVKVHPKCSSSLMNPLLLRRNNFEAIASVRISVAKFLVFVSRTSTLPLSLSVTSGRPDSMTPTAFRKSNAALLH